LANIISAPASTSSSGETALTDASVPTGINAGVLKTPCGVETDPVLARQVEDLWYILNFIFDEPVKSRTDG